ncbi:hypothetical protein IGM04_002760 [Enterococcus sp. DIV2385]|nr:hypothetical protein [Enterococcus faecalis]OTP10733.1 hypothetical protein A5830_002798 [Enterococcus faecalis]
MENQFLNSFLNELFSIFFRLVAPRDLVKLSQIKHRFSRDLKRLAHQYLWGKPYKNFEILPLLHLLNLVQSMLIEKGKMNMPFMVL